MANLIKKDKFYMYFDSDYIDIYSKNLNENELIFKDALESSPLYLNYYKEVKSIVKIYEAGFFIETNNKLINEHETYLDVNKLLKNKEDTKDNVVLLTFGAFSPLHKGHLDMLEEAKNDCIANGLNVCGGIISLSHDEYVSSKRNGSASLHAVLRSIEADKEITKLSRNWISVDMWESMYVNRALNLDKVVNRFVKILSKHDIKVVVVYGSDNKDFNHVLKGILNYCVLRKEEKLEHVKNHITNPDTRLIVNNLGTSYYSSTAKREKGYKNPETSEKCSEMYYEIRNDIEISLKYLKITKEKSQEYFKTMSEIFKKYVVNNPEILEINLENQLEVYYEHIKKLRLGIISNDIYDKNQNISVSRVFDILTNQIQSSTLINRETKQILGKLDILKNGDCVLVDDDIASGYTTKKIKELLPDGIDIVKILGMNDLVRDINKPAFDIVDARDFILGAENGGLQCYLNNSIERVPYFYPYVNLYTRASVNKNNQKEFMLAIYNLNIKIYTELEEQLNKNILINDLKNNKEFLNWLGYKDSDRVLNVLKKEIEKILLTY